MAVDRLHHSHLREDHRAAVFGRARVACHLKITTAASH